MALQFSVNFTMSVRSTCRFILLLMVWLCHVATTLNASSGYYMNPFLLHTHYLRFRLYPQRTSTAFVLSGHNLIVLQETPVVDNQEHLMPREYPVPDSQGDVGPWSDSGTGSQVDCVSRNEPVVLNQSQDIGDAPSKMHSKHALNPCPRKKEPAARGGDSVTFVETKDDQQDDPEAKLLSKGSSFPAGHDVPDYTTSKPHPNVEDPSRCVWAILSCCSPGSNKVRQSCFELLGCPGPFWDTNPCNKGMTASAVKVVDQFYSRGKLE